MSDAPAEAVGARVDALEIRVAYQDRTIEELNAAVTDQWKQIDALKRRVESLVDRVRDAETRTSSGGTPEPPPPHY